MERTAKSEAKSESPQLRPVHSQKLDVYAVAMLEGEGVVSEVFRLNPRERLSQVAVDVHSQRVGRQSALRVSEAIPRCRHRRCL